MPGPPDRSPNRPPHRPPPRPQPHALPPGFEFVRVLGLGADGWVCLAREVDLDRLVAIKTVLGGALVPGGATRLAREARVLASLRHPHVVRVHRLVELGPDVALCEEFVDGPSLAQALADPAHPVHHDAAWRVGMLEDVADALGHCAQRGVVHRDLKPGNILLTDSGSAKVADFGLARLSRSAAAFRTSAGVVSGTPGYVAPEQLHDPDHEDPAADHYSFAVVALECLTGERVAVVGLDRLLDRLPAALLPPFRGALAHSPGERWPPPRLLEAVRAHRAVIAPEPALRGTSPAPEPGPEPAPEPAAQAVTVRAATTRHTAAPEDALVDQSRADSAGLADGADVAPAPPGPDPGGGPEEQVPLSAEPWVVPATVGIARAPWWRRHPSAVGLGAGALLVGLAVAVAQVLAR
jgi:hypothetical protein